MSSLSAQELGLGYGDRLVVDGLDITLAPARITALVGPNGCGKSTILKGLARILRPRHGAVLIDGAAIATQPSRQVARRLAILPQTPEAPEGLTVRQLASYGRFPYQGGFGTLKAADETIIERALVAAGLADLADRAVDQLSGGQRQRAWIAMALAQDTPIMLLDEPTTFLDLAHQLEVLTLLERLNAEQGRTIVMVLHDLNQAARFANHIVAVDAGRIVAQGEPAGVITPSLLASVFGVEATVTTDPRTGRPVATVYGLSAAR